ncbi:uncharacterized protein VTP21DRAFT_3517 [Calcarisporiella thermophila]|uniref:uncharacterized protein n=1 Tax=Calcarisporiella thermophila TaxID=911321 RepID=UPI00374270F6
MGKTNWQELEYYDYSRGGENTIRKITTRGAKKASPKANGFLSNLFPKREKTKIRPLLDLRRINRYVQYQHFKMEGLPTIRDMIQPGDYLIKVDLSNAYLTIPVHL